VQVVFIITFGFMAEDTKMGSSVNTNVGAMTAVRVLGNNTRALEGIQNRISSGLKVANAKDNGASYGIAQQQRAEVRAFEAVSQGLSRATSAADVGLAAGEAISDVFVQMREKALAATGPTISATSRASYNEDFISLRDQVASIISNAVFDGINLIGGPGPGPGPTDLNFPASTDGLQVMTLPVLDFNLTASPIAMGGPPGIYLDMAQDLTSDINAQDALDRIVVSLDYINQELSRLGTAAKRIDTHMNFISRLSDSIVEGIGNIVDANLASESAHLQALQVKQQMSTQALNIANQSPQTLLNLLRG
jgi:flagellin